MRSNTWAALLLLVALVAWLAWAESFWFVTDDAFISFRYARNWVGGPGLRYNPGDHVPVEGYSNFLWVAVAALVELLGGAPATWMPLLSLLCGLAFVPYLYRSALDRFDLAPPVGLATALLLAFAPGTVVWATGGLATLPAAFALYVCFDRWVLSDDPGDARVGAGAALALALLRTEGIAWVAVTAVLAVLVRRPVRRRARPVLTALGAVLASYAVYFALRYAHFGTLLANTASAKVHLGAESASRGLDYVLGYWLEALTPPFALLCVLAAWPVGRWRGLSVGAMAFGVPLYAVLVGGDFMTMGRLLVPGVAFSALLVGFALQLAWSRGAVLRTLALAGALALVVVGTLPLLDVQLVPKDVRREHRVRWNTSAFRTEHAQWRFMNGNAKQWTHLGLALAQVARPGDSIVLGAIGAVGYHSGLYVYDRYGLVSRDVVEREAKHGRAQRTSPGHDMVVPVGFFLDDDPTFLYAEVLRGRRTVRRAPGVVAGWSVSAAMRDRYGPAVYPVIVDGEEAWLVVMERTDDPQAAWDGLRDRVEALGASERRG